MTILQHFLFHDKLIIIGYFRKHITTNWRQVLIIDVMLSNDNFRRIHRDSGGISTAYNKCEQKIEYNVNLDVFCMYLTADIIVLARCETEAENHPSLRKCLRLDKRTATSRLTEATVLRFITLHASVTSTCTFTKCVVLVVPLSISAFTLVWTKMRVHLRSNPRRLLISLSIYLPCHWVSMQSSRQGCRKCATQLAVTEATITC